MIPEATAHEVTWDAPNVGQAVLYYELESQHLLHPERNSIPTAMHKSRLLAHATIQLQALQCPACIFANVDIQIP